MVVKHFNNAPSSYNYYFELTLDVSCAPVSRFDERKLLLFAGIFPMIVARAIMFPLPFYDPPGRGSSITEPPMTTTPIDEITTTAAFLDYDSGFSYNRKFSSTKEISERERVVTMTSELYWFLSNCYC